MLKLLFKKVFTATLQVLLLFGCAETVKLPEITTELDYSWRSNVPVDSLPITKSILTFIKNERVDSLVAEAVRNNYNLKAAQKRLESSDYVRAHVKSLMMPSASLSFSKGRGNQNINLLTGKHETKNSHNISLGVSWEVDVWGKLYEANSAANFAWEAQREQYISAIDALAARTVQTWLYLISAKKEISLKKENENRLLNLRNSTLEKYRRGLVSLSVLHSVKNQYNIHTAELVSLNENYNKLKRELELLLGRKPNADIDIEIDFPAINKPIVKIPAVVLANRPDVKSAVLMLNSSLKQASVAKKEMLPSISLSADMFKESVKAGDLSGSTLIWNVIGNIVQPIFNGGKLWNEAKSRSREAEASMNELHSVILNALKEVEDGLEAERSLVAQMEQYSKAVNNSKINFEDSNRRYSKGIIEFEDLISVQNETNELEIAVYRIETELLANRINLAIATGYNYTTEDDGAL